MSVYEVLNDIIENQGVTSQHLYDLLQILKNSPQEFLEHLENCYLKLFKEILRLKSEKTTLETFTEKFFNFVSKIYLKPNEKLAIGKDILKVLISNFVVFFTEAMESQ